MNLKNWISQNNLDCTFLSETQLRLNEKSYLILKHKDGLIFDQDFDIIISEEEQEELNSNNIDYLIYEFGGKWYFTEKDKSNLNILKNIGIIKPNDLHINMPYLGIHGKYEICSGSRDYIDWCKKANFLNISTLGICESNTLAGTLSFQLACKKYGIKSILGETVSVQTEKLDYTIKLYVKDEKGWNNLLHINAEIKAKNEGYVTEDYILENSSGLICILTSHENINIKKYINSFKEDLYFQVDSVEWSSDEKDKEYLLSLKSYFDTHIETIKPILICDSFYLDKDEAHIKKSLNQIGKIGFSNQSKNQYFKTSKDIYLEFKSLFKDEDRLLDIFELSLAALDEVNEKCNFEIELGVLHLPQYELREDQKHYESHEALFWDLIFKGFERKVVGKGLDEQVYLDRIQREAEVIIKGNLVDYFLILWDIIDWCKDNDILVGIGRGSAAGSLIVYCLDIVKIDPLKFDLIFERFINEVRILKGLPDIDCDFASDKRDDVKRYMEQRYGIDNVTSIGTYGTFKARAGIKDLARIKGIDNKLVNYVTSIIDPEASIEEIFRLAANTSVIKTFIQNNFEIFNDLPLILNQPKTESVHAAGVIITPKNYNGKSLNIYDWIPVKKVDGVLVSEWEGPQLENAGFLKEDILGIRQLEKFTEIFKLIKLHIGDIINFEEIDIAQEEVYNLFKEGQNEDVFQFGAIGLKSYCAELKPENIEDLIATVALYRPGPMESGAHKEFIKLKNGLKEPEYDYMLEDVTKSTYGTLCYQEQGMKAMQVLGGLNLIEADIVRSAFGKKDMDKLQKYKAQFLEGAKSNKCDQYEAIKIWNKIEAFAKYSFNKSHAAAYAHIGYYCQWLKYNYPLEFWTVSLLYASDEEISSRIGEMHKVSNVKVLPPDINESTTIFKPNVKDQNIYWSIGSIKFVGEKALNVIINERDKNGKYYSFEDFYSRVDKRLVNKRCVLNLILSGCFDKIQNIANITDRLKLINFYYNEILFETIPEDFNSNNTWKEYFWILKQKELTGFGYLDLDKIFTSNYEVKGKYVDPQAFYLENSVGNDKCVVGVIAEIAVKSSKKGQFAQITLDCNSESHQIIIWNEIWEILKDDVLGKENKILIISGDIKFDSYRLKNVMQTNKKTKLIIL